MSIEIESQCQLDIEIKIQCQLGIEIETQCQQEGGSPVIDVSPLIPTT